MYLTRSFSLGSRLSHRALAFARLPLYSILYILYLLSFSAGAALLSLSLAWCASHYILAARRTREKGESGEHRGARAFRGEPIKTRHGYNLWALTVARPTRRAAASVLGEYLLSSSPFSLLLPCLSPSSLLHLLLFLFFVYVLSCVAHISLRGSNSSHRVSRITPIYCTDSIIFSSLLMCAYIHASGYLD